jgi:hypothetical protein
MLFTAQGIYFTLTAQQIAGLGPPNRTMLRHIRHRKAMLAASCTVAALAIHGSAHTTPP